MYATIQRWGNSQGLRIPKALLDALGLRENDRVELIQSDDGIQIKKAASAHKAEGCNPKLTAVYAKLAKIESEIEKLIDTLTRATTLLSAPADSPPGRAPRPPG